MWLSTVELYCRACIAIHLNEGILVGIRLILQHVESKAAWLAP